MNKKLNIITISLLGLTILSSCTTKQAINPNEGLPEAKVTAKSILDKVKVGYNIGNTFDACIPYSEWEKDKKPGESTTETSWGNGYVTKQYIEKIKSTGFGAIRLPITWFNHCDEYYRIDPDWLDRIYEVTNWCVEIEIPVIIDIHHDTGVNGWLKASQNPEKQQKQERYFTKIWTQIANKFKDLPNEYVLFEGYNEAINEKGDWNTPSRKEVSYVNSLAQLFVDTIRDTGGNNGERVLICTTYCGSHYSYMVDDFEIPKDRVNGALVVEVHAYVPWSYTNGEVKNYSKGDLEGCMENLYNKFNSSNVPVIIGEFGFNFNHAIVDENSYLQYFEDYMSASSKRNIKCFYWDDGGDFKLIDHKTLEITKPKVLDKLLLK